MLSSILENDLLILNDEAETIIHHILQTKKRWYVLMIDKESHVDDYDRVFLWF